MIEVVIATLVLAIAVSAMFSVALTSQLRMKRNLSRDELNQHGRRVLDELKNYVTEQPTSLTSPAGGPNSGAWNHPNDVYTCGGAPQPAAWALQETGPGCAHDLSSMLPTCCPVGGFPCVCPVTSAPRLRDPPYNARMTYTVTLVPMGSKKARQVDLRLRWDEPD